MVIRIIEGIDVENANKTYLSATLIRKLSPNAITMVKMKGKHKYN
jgi:hypothetical protein